jgi:hypothetical protein
MDLPSYGIQDNWNSWSCCRSCESFMKKMVF